MLNIFSCACWPSVSSLEKCLFRNSAHFFFNHLYWSIIALQWCVSFCFITKWISYTYTYIPISPPSCISLPPTLPISPLHLPPSYPPYPTPPGGHKAPSRSPCAMRLLPTRCPFFHQVVCFVVVELFEFFVYFGYLPLIGYMICKNILPFTKLTVHFDHCFPHCTKAFLVWCSLICLFSLLFPLPLGVSST